MVEKTPTDKRGGQGKASNSQPLLRILGLCCRGQGPSSPAYPRGALGVPGDTLSQAPSVFLTRARSLQLPLPLRRRNVFTDSLKAAFLLLQPHRRASGEGGRH